MKPTKIDSQTKQPYTVVTLQQRVYPHTIVDAIATMILDGEPAPTKAKIIKEMRRELKRKGDYAFSGTQLNERYEEDAEIGRRADKLARKLFPEFFTKQP